MDGVRLLRQTDVATPAAAAAPLGFFGSIRNPTQAAADQLSAVADKLYDKLAQQFPTIIATAQRELIPAPDELTDLVSLFTELYKQLQKADDRGTTLWAIHELVSSLSNLLQGNEQDIHRRLERYFTPARELSAVQGKVKPLDREGFPHLIQLLQDFKTNLEAYQDILEGKKEESRMELRNLRIWLMNCMSDQFRDEEVEEIPASLDLTDDVYKHLDLESKEQIDAALAEQPPLPRPERPERRHINGKGILDVLKSLKANCEGIGVSLLETFGRTTVHVVAKSTSDWFRSQIGLRSEGCIHPDDLDQPPIELETITISEARSGHPLQKRTVVLIKRNIVNHPLSVGHLVDIFSGFLNRGETDGLYELWARFLLTYFEQLERGLATAPTAPALGRIQGQEQGTAREDVRLAKDELLQLLSRSQPGKEAVQAAFRRVGELMNKHPLLILNMTELDLGSLFGTDDTDATQAERSLIHRVNTASTRVQSRPRSEILTKEQEEANFHTLILETGELGYLFSLYQTVLKLLGGSSTRVTFNEIYTAIATDENGKTLPEEIIRARFKEQLVYELIDPAGDVWIIWRWFIKIIILPIISGVIDLGIGYFVQGAKDSVDGWLENIHLGEGQGTMHALDELKAASKKISDVAKDPSNQNKPKGERLIFSRGLLEDTSSFDGRSTKDVYDEFTVQMVDNILKENTIVVDWLNNLDGNIVAMIAEIDLFFVRTALSVAAYVIRIPLWIVTNTIVRPIQYAVNLGINASLKWLLVYTSVVEKAVNATNAALTESRSQRTEITPIIDRTMLGILETVIEALSTNEDGEHVDLTNIDFKKYVSTPEHKRKLSTALGALFDAIESIQNMETDRDVGEFEKFLRKYASRRGVEACSDVAIGALQALTEPRMVLHMGNLVLGSVTESLKASGTELDLEEDDEIREQISEKMKQLVALSMHVAEQTLTAPDPECDIALGDHVARIKSMFLTPAQEALDGEEPAQPGDQLTGRIAAWRETLTAYCQSNDQNENPTQLFQIRAELFRIWRSLQKDLIDLENDKTTKTASLNVHKRQLRAMIDALEQFQGTYWVLHEEALRTQFLEHHQELVEPLTRTSDHCAQIQRRLQALINDIQRDQAQGILCGINLTHIQGSTQQIENAMEVILNFEETITDVAQYSVEMRALIEGARSQFASLTELQDRLTIHARMIKFAKQHLGQDDRQRSLRASLDSNGSFPANYVRNFVIHLKEAFPEHQRTSSRDHEVVSKIEIALRILEGTETLTNKRAQITAIEEILERTCKLREPDMLGHLQQGVRIAGMRVRTTGEEVARLEATQGRSEANQLALFRRESLERITTQLTILTASIDRMTPPKAVPWTIDTDFMKVPLLRQLLQTANSELTKRLMNIYAKMIANKDIATFLAIRMGFLPAIQ